MGKEFKSILRSVLVSTVRELLTSSTRTLPRGPLETSRVFISEEVGNRRVGLRFSSGKSVNTISVLRFRSDTRSGRRMRVPPPPPAIPLLLSVETVPPPPRSRDRISSGTDSRLC